MTCEFRRTEPKPAPIQRKRSYLRRVLREVASRIPYAPDNVQISWAPADSMTFRGDDTWAEWIHTDHDTHWIGIHECLKTAPDYVIRYLVAHELLHVVFRPRKGARILHTRPHVVADRIWPDYERATKWLEAHA